MARLYRLDALRVGATGLVYVHHFVSTFYLATLVGVTALQHHAWERWFYATPLGVLINGNFAVHIFFVLTGFLLTHHFYANPGARVRAVDFLRRYLRLAGPVLVSVLLAYVLLSVHAVHNVELAAAAGSSAWLGALWQFSPSLWGALQQGVFWVFVGNNTSYNPVLWMIHYELLGAFLLFLFWLVPLRRWRWLATLVLLGLCLASNYQGFWLGALLAELYVQRFEFMERCFDSWVSWLVLVTAIIAGSFPMYSNGELSSFYQVLQAPFFGFGMAQLTYHALGAALLTAWVLWSPAMGHSSAWRILPTLASISFSFYLIHFVFISAGASLVFLALYPLLPYDVAVAITFVVSTVVLLPLAYLFYRLVDKPTLKLTHRLGSESA